MNANDIWMIIKHESGGNPNAINNWDSNAAKGTPSKGLMQTIDPTFNRWKLAGHDNIYNPVDNIIAGVRYAIERYGSVSNVPGVVGTKTGSGYRGY
jgi:SLT domain-containing protein